MPKNTSRRTLLVSVPIALCAAAVTDGYGGEKQEDAAIATASIIADHTQKLLDALNLAGGAEWQCKADESTGFILFHRVV